MPPVAFVETQGLHRGDLGDAVELPRQALELRVVVQANARRHARLANVGLALLRIGHIESEAQGRDGADIGAHRHRRLAALDAVQRDPRHAGGFGGRGGSYLVALAVRANALAERDEPGRQEVADGWGFGRP